MSSNYKRLLLTTCLPAIAFTLYTSLPANAGFEWTPPEKIEVAPELIDPMSAMDDMEPIMQEVLPAEIEPAMPVVEEAAPMPIVEDVIEDIAEPMEIIEDAIIESPPEPLNVAAPEIIVENVPVTAEEALIAIPEAEEQMPEIIKAVPEIAEDAYITIPEDVPNTEAETIIEEVAVEASETVIEEVATEDIVTEMPSKLTIMPFPDKEIDGNIVQNPVVLSEDQNTEVEVEAHKEEILWNEKEAFDVLEGFGTDLPLALVLRQIVPAQYAFSFGDGVNMAQNISWQGGKPWNDVLQDALAPANLTYNLSNSKITIQKTNAAEVITPVTPVVQEDVVEESALDDIYGGAVELPVEETPVVEEVIEAPVEEEPAFLDIEPQTIDTKTPERKTIIDPGVKETMQPSAPQYNPFTGSKKK